MEVRGEVNQHLSGLAPAYMENYVGETLVKNDSSPEIIEKVCPQQDSSMNFGAGLVCLRPLAALCKLRWLRGGVLWTMPLACVRKCLCAHSDPFSEPAGSLGAGLWGFPGDT